MDAKGQCMADYTAVHVRGDAVASAASYCWRRHHLRNVMLAGDSAAASHEVEQAASESS
jgi:hypothetical protein